jgi:CRP-like cAMP-binding protein
MLKADEPQVVREPMRAQKLQVQVRRSASARQGCPRARVDTSYIPSVCNRRCAFIQSAIGATSAGLGGQETIQFHRNEAIYREGVAADYCFKIAKGAVRISCNLRSGNRQVVDLLFSGDAFGLEPGKNYVGTAEAATDVAVLRCRRACLSHMSLQDDAGAALALLLSRRLRAAQDHVMLLGHQSARARVATFLLRLSVRQNPANERTVEQLVSRQDLADYLGLTLETTCRALSDLKQLGIISAPTRREIVIHDVRRLTEASAGAAA